MHTYDFVLVDEEFDNLRAEVTLITPHKISSVEAEFQAVLMFQAIESYKSILS